MKKTLKVIASAAVAMSAFASVAMADDAATTTTSTSTSATTAPATKTSADFKDLATIDAGLKAKIDALLKAGVFEGTAADQFGIDQNMTRAQFAKVLDLIYNVNVDMAVTTSSFSDVKADDQANGWAIPYIEAAKKAGLIDGVTDTTFNPGDNVTLGQFATALVKGLGVKPDMTGTPWYADAVKQAITKNVLPADTDGSKLATRADLVVGAYGGQQAFADMNKPAAVSVVSAKATGVKTVTVTFDRDVDTSKATLALTKGTASVATTTAFADDKKSATLTLTDTTLRAGDYTVTLGGLDASAIKTATGTFTAQDETVQKLEFVSTSDTIAISSEATVLLKATNQYGENASFSGGNYTLTVSNSDVGNTKIDKTSDGLLKITLDTKTNATGGGGNNHLQTSISVIPITVWNNDSRVTVTKNFTLGTAALITKVEAGDIVYSNGGQSINKSGETATFELKPYDQYGNLLSFKAVKEAIGETASDTEIGAKLNTNGKVQVIFNPYEENLNYSIQDFDNNNTVKARVSLKNNVDKSGDYTAQVYLQGATATAKISVNSTAVADKVQIGDLGDVIASGDQDVYVPIIAYDANGNQLSIADLTSNANVDRIKVSVSGATALNEDLSTGSDAKIYKSGDHKGSIRLSNITAGSKGVVTITAYIATANASSNAVKNYTVNNPRVPTNLKIVNAPAKELVAGAKSKFTYQVLDQYGKSMDKAYAVDSNGNIVTTTDGSASGINTLYNATTNVHYIVDVTDVSGIDGTNIKLARDDDSSTAFTGPFSTPSAVSVGASTYAVQNTSFGTFNDDYDIYTTNAATGSLSYTVNLRKVTGAYDASTNPGQVIDKITRQATIVTNASNEDLTYSINSVAALFNAKDSGSVTDYVYDGTNTISKDSVQLKPELSKLAREVTISAKNAAGDTVAIPKKITSIGSSNPNVALVSTNGAGQAYVLGYKAGTAQLAVSFTAADGSVKTLTTDVTVKNDPISVASVSWDDSSKTRPATGYNAFTGLNVVDNYGVKFEDGTIQQYNYLLGVTFAISNPSVSGITISPYGDITGPVGAKFDLVATSANGQSATTSITLN